MTPPVATAEPKDCSAPWGQPVKNGKSVLAYQQRTDDTSICNIQRRLCTDGVLGGTYMQRSCKELYKGTAFSTSRWGNANYVDVGVASDSSSTDTSLTQPKPPTGTGRNFNTRGQI